MGNFKAELSVFFIVERGVELKDNLTSPSTTHGVGNTGRIQAAFSPLCANVGPTFVPSLVGII